MAGEGRCWRAAMRAGASRCTTAGRGCTLLCHTPMVASTMA